MLRVAQEPQRPLQDLEQLVLVQGGSTKPDVEIEPLANERGELLLADADAARLQQRRLCFAVVW